MRRSGIDAKFGDTRETEPAVVGDRPGKELRRA